MVNAKATIAALLLAGTLSAPVQAHPAISLSQPQEASLHNTGWGKTAWGGIRHVGELIGEHIGIAVLLEYLKTLFGDDDPCRALQKLIVKVREIEHLTAKEKAAIVSRIEGVMASKCKADEQTTVLQKADKQK